MDAVVVLTSVKSQPPKLTPRITCDSYGNPQVKERADFAEETTVTVSNTKEWRLGICILAQGMDW